MDTEPLHVRPRDAAVRSQRDGSDACPRRSGRAADQVGCQSVAASVAAESSWSATTGRFDPCVLWKTRSTTADTVGARETFRVTHPYHPLFGREYPLVTYCHGWGNHRVYFHDEAGRFRKVPACWTDVVADDPFVVVAAGRSAFRVADLLKLADLLEALQPRPRRRGAGRSASV